MATRLAVVTAAESAKAAGAPSAVHTAPYTVLAAMAVAWVACRGRQAVVKPTLCHGRTTKRVREDEGQAQGRLSVWRASK